MCFKKKKFIPHCPFLDCMEFGPNDVKEHTCEDCIYWVDSPEVERFMSVYKWEYEKAKEYKKRQDRKQ